MDCCFLIEEGSSEFEGDGEFWFSLDFGFLVYSDICTLLWFSVGEVEDGFDGLVERWLEMVLVQGSRVGVSWQVDHLKVLLC